MKKGKGIAVRVGCGLVVLFVSLFIFVPLSTADEGSSSGSTGKVSGFLNKLKDPFSGLPNIFSELSPADVGHKPRIRPHFAFNQGYTSNAQFGQKQADAAWQARIAPGITLSVPSGKLYTEVDYTYGFSTTQGRKTHANVNTHNISALARYDLTADTTIGVGNNLQLSEVPGAEGDTFLLETATAQVKHRLSQKLIASLGDTIQVFNDRATNRENDFVDNGVSAALSYDATADLSVGPTFAWNTRHFDDISAKNYWQIQPGVAGTYRLGPKTTVGGNFDWALRKFEKGTNDSESELVYGASVTHLLGRKFVWSLNYQKSLQDTFDTGFVFKDTPEVTALDNLDRDFRVVKSHRLGTSATYHINESSSVGAFGDFQFLISDAKDKVVNPNSKNERAMEVGARYTYRITRYINFDILYAFGRRFTSEDNPNLNRQEYTFHKITGGVNIAV